MSKNRSSYVGRYAPTPSGLLHKGHAATFAQVLLRSRQFGGKTLLRIEDLDQQRCKPQFEKHAIEDLEWLGLKWDQDNIVRQSDRLDLYQRYLKRLVKLDLVYPSYVSRKQINQYPGLRRNQNGEVVFPEKLREHNNIRSLSGDSFELNWRFRVQSGCEIDFIDQRSGLHSYRGGEDFGDFLVWTKSGYPSYELAVVVDDIENHITEVVRGEDLLVSTARQILLYQAFDVSAPDFYHCPLIRDDEGVRLAKSYDSESIRSYRERGFTATQFWNMLDINLSKNVSLG